MTTLQIIDEFLSNMTGRDLFSADEVRDLLLDLRRSEVPAAVPDEMVEEVEREAVSIATSGEDP